MVEVLGSGGMVAIPTETVYGLAVDALDASAVASVFAAKGRPATDPLIVHLGSGERIDTVVREWSDVAHQLADAFWPGPLTIVAPRHPSVLPALSAGRDTIAVRVPAHPVAEAVLAAFDGPLAAPSANRFGRVSPTEADHVMAELGGRIHMVLDAGPTPLGVESTVIDVTGARPMVLRPGGVTVEMLTPVVGEVDVPERLVVDTDEAAASPGQSIAHYSPSTPVVLVDAGPDVIEALTTAVQARGVRCVAMDLGGDAESTARRLYRDLRAVDSGDADIALAPVMDPRGLGRAVNDRLFRAARGRVVLDATPDTVKRLADIAAGDGR